MDSTSDADGPESEEENPYPLEGKYIDEYDRQRYIATLSPCVQGPAKSFIGFWKCPKSSERRSLPRDWRSSNALQTNGILTKC